MKRVLLTLVASAFYAISFAQVEAQEAAVAAPTAEKVIAKYLEVTGGKEKYSKIKSIVAEGEMAIPQAGLSGKMKVSQAAGGKGLIEITLPGIGEQKIGSDGKVHWEASQVTGAQLLTGERKEQVELQLQIGALASYIEYFDSVECTGAKDFEGTKCYELVSKKGDSDPMYDYFSVESGLHVGSKLKAATPMGKLEIVSVMSDYKDVGGFKMSHLTVAKLPNGMTQEVKINSYKLDVDLPEGIFDLPDEVKALVK